MRLSLPIRLAAAGCAAALFAGSAMADTIEVRVFDVGFSDVPGSMTTTDTTINLGDTVMWVWESGFHSTTSVAGLSESWDSGQSAPPFDFSHTFNNLGAFPYYCSVHGADNGDGTASGMSATIFVIPAPGAAALGLAGLVVGARRRRR